MTSTLLLDRSGWDLCIDALGNIALASDPYATLQNAASAVRVFSGEAYYDTTIGIPFLDAVFNGSMPVAVLRETMAREAKAVPGVTAASIAIASITARAVVGQLQVTLADGTTQTAAL